MLSFSQTTKVYLATGATDMRKAFDTLAALVSERLGRDPYAGDVFVFCNRPRNRLKLLVWEPSGFWLCAKRLEKGTFAWPNSSDVSVTLTPQELSLLLGGIDLSRVERRQWYEGPLTKEKKEAMASV